jgi:Right handed beta helix region
MNKIKLLIVFCSVCCHTMARDYFVAPTPAGSNSNTGTITSPLATIQYALSLAQPGDTVQLRLGTYNEKLNWVRSGTTGNLITLKNYQQEQAIVDGTGKTGESLLAVKKMSYIGIQGIIFQNNYQQEAKGIYVDTSGKTISIRNCTVRNIGWTTNANADPFGVNPNGSAHAILFVGRSVTGIDSIKITGCKIYDIISGNSEAVTIAGNTDAFEIDRDTVYNTKNIGIVAAGHYPWSATTGIPDSINQARNGTISNCLVYDNRRFSNLYAPAGIYVDGGRNINILNNRSYKNGNGISIGCETPGYTARNITLMNNQVYNNDNSGLTFGSNQGSSVVKKSTVINNSFLNNGSLLTNPSEIILQNTDSCLIANNIAIPGGDYHYGIAVFGYTNSNLTVTNNLLYRYTGFATDLYVPGTPAQFTPVNTVSADPGFLSSILPNPNLGITNASAAINMGSNAYSLISDIDAAGNYRIVNGMVDMGAYERQDGGCPNIFTINDTHVLKGKFVASQQIIFNRSQPTMLTSPMLWSSPLVSLLSPVQLFSTVTVSPAGCN